MLGDRCVTIRFSFGSDAEAVRDAQHKRTRLV
jgi:hypothetical protein